MSVLCEKYLWAVDIESVVQGAREGHPNWQKSRKARHKEAHDCCPCNRVSDEPHFDFRAGDFADLLQDQGSEEICGYEPKSPRRDRKDESLREQELHDPRTRHTDHPHDTEVKGSRLDAHN
jgi:hypothetical protein